MNAKLLLIFDNREITLTLIVFYLDCIFVTVSNNRAVLTFREFCQISHVRYWRKQLNVSNIANFDINKHGGTQRCYTYGLFKFNQWLSGKSLTIKTTIQIDMNVFSYKTTQVRIKDVGHFLDLYQNSNTKPEFVRLIKQYLIWLQDHKGLSTVNNALYSIRSFFRENDTDIDFRFHTKKSFSPEQCLMTLNDFESLITVNGIQKIEKAVFLCKFHRGLDSSTFADRFNFEAMEQLIEHFGTSNSALWDVTKCPVPIKLTRVKTNYQHTGFLDVDAVKAIQDYLKSSSPYQNTRKSKNHYKKIYECRNKPQNILFFDLHGKPISINWIRRRFNKLRRRVKDHNRHTQKDFTSHDLRDLLKSTLIDSGCRLDVADHVIGHSPKDSYEKQALLYPESLRTEFSKCSNRINFLEEECIKAQSMCTDQHMGDDSDFSVSVGRFARRAVRTAVVKKAKVAHRVGDPRGVQNECNTENHTGKSQCNVARTLACECECNQFLDISNSTSFITQTFYI